MRGYKEIAKRTIVTDFDDEGEVSDRISVEGAVMRSGPHNVSTILSIDIGNPEYGYEDRQHVSIPLRHLDEVIEMLERTRDELKIEKKIAHVDVNDYFGENAEDAA